MQERYFAAMRRDEFELAKGAAGFVMGGFSHLGELAVGISGFPDMVGFAYKGGGMYVGSIQEARERGDYLAQTFKIGRERFGVGRERREIELIE